MGGITYLSRIGVSATDPAELRRFDEDTRGLERVPSSAARVELPARGPERHVLGLVAGDGHSRERIELSAESATDACSRGSRSSPRSTGMSRGCGQIVVESGPAETVRAWTGKS